MSVGRALPQCCQNSGRFQRIPEDTCRLPKSSKSVKAQGLSPEVPRHHALSKLSKSGSNPCLTARKPANFLTKWRVDGVPLVGRFSPPAHSTHLSVFSTQTR